MADKVSSAKESEIAKIDKNMAVQTSTADGMDWYTVDSPGFEFSGMYWRKPGGDFRRLPLNTPELDLTQGVDWLAWNTAGAMLRFRTDAPEIRIKASFRNINRMDHMAFVGIMGFDLYEGSGTDKHYLRSTRFSPDCEEYLVPVFGAQGGVEFEKKMREFTLHFPLYSGVKSFEIGLTSGSVVEPPSPWKDPRPVVVYGTSIQQGGCASRPGMCHTNRMSRLLDRPFINLAFSGSGKGEPVMARLLSEIEDPAMYVLDYSANAGLQGIRDTQENFIRILREKHPVTPILLVSRYPYAREYATLRDTGKFTAGFIELTETYRKHLEKFRSEGDEHIYFLDGTTLLGDYPEDCTVDGVHGTDLGFYKISNVMAPVIRKILEGGRP